MQDSQFACNGSITSNWRPDNGLNQHLASHHTDRPRARAGRWLLRAGRWLLRAAPRHGSGTLRDCANFRQLCLELGLAISLKIFTGRTLPRRTSQIFTFGIRCWRGSAQQQNLRRQGG